MSEVGRSARVSITVADYVAPGLANKLTIVGAGITVVGSDPLSGMTPGISVVAVVTFDSKFLGESPVVELSLETGDGVAVELPTVAGGPEGDSQVLRVGGASPLQPTVALIEGVYIPADALRPKVQVLLQFQNGLPLKSGQQYVWRVTIDGDSRDEWCDVMYVPEVIASAE